MEFQLSQYQLEYLKKYEYIKLSDWRRLNLPNGELMKEYENGNISFKKFKSMYLNNKKNKSDFYYVGDTSQLNKDEMEEFYDKRIDNLIKDRNYYIKNSLINKKI